MKLEKLLKWDRFSKILKNIHSDFGPNGHDCGTVGK